MKITKKPSISGRLFAFQNFPFGIRQPDDTFSSGKSFEFASSEYKP
jgi:hypothetical protein